MNKTPRIYVAISQFFPFVGGAETQTLRQCQRLIQRGYQTHVVTFHHQSHWACREKVQGVPTLRVAGIFLGRREYFPRILSRFMYLCAILTMALTLWQHRHRYDILQVCQFSIMVVPLALVCLLARKPMLITLISAGADKASKTSATKTLMAGPLDPQTPWLQVDGSTWIDGDLYSIQAAGPLVVKFTRYLLNRIGTIIVVLSSRMMRYLKENQFDLPGACLIPNSVDTTQFYPQRWEKEDDEAQQYTVVCVSQLRYEKGLDVLLQAWRIVIQKCPQARLIIVGRGAIQRQLHQMAIALKIIESVEFTGQQSNVLAQLHRGNIFVQPSRWEGMPNALLEAMASGCACIATQVSGSEDLIQHGVNGLLVQPENDTVLALAILMLMEDKQRTIRYGQAARKLVEEHYTIDSILDRYIEVYTRLTNQKTKNTQISDEDKLVKNINTTCKSQS